MLGKLYDAGQKIKAFIASVALIVGGILLLVLDPSKLDDGTIPMWVIQPVAVMMLVLGSSMLTAVVFGLGKGRFAKAIASRARAALALEVCVMVMIFLVMSQWDDVGHAIRLSENGVEAQGQIVDREVRIGRNGKYQTKTFAYLIAYDGYETEYTNKLEGHPETGTRFSILYLPDEPSVMRPGQRADSILTLVRNGMTTLAFWIHMAVAGIALLVSLFALKGILLGGFGEDPSAAVAVGK